jgi:hypothetical protein
MYSHGKAGRNQEMKEGKEEGREERETEGEG